MALPRLDRGINRAISRNLKNRHPGLDPGSIGPLSVPERSLFSMDARVKPEHDEKDVAGAMTLQL
jgi:hypothetical protein